MAQAVLIVEQDDLRRSQLRSAFAARGVPVYEAADAAAAMLTLGRADLGALLASEGRRHLSLKGLCLLARRRHPGIRLVVLSHDDVTEAELRQRLGVDFDLWPQEVAAHEAVDALLAAAPSLLSPFDLPAPTEVVQAPPRFSQTRPQEEAPRTDSASAPTRQAPRTAARSTRTCSDASIPLADASTRMAAAPPEDFAETTLVDEETAVEVPSLDDVSALDDVSSLDEPEPRSWFAEPADTDPASGGHAFAGDRAPPDAPQRELPAAPRGTPVLDGAPTVEVPRVSEAYDARDRAAAQAALRDEIFALYRRLQPLARPALVLGVPLDASLPEVERAYRGRMAALDPERVAAGAAGDVVRARMDELRAKVARAYEAMRLQLETSGSRRPARRGRKGDTNPW